MHYPLDGAIWYWGKKSGVYFDHPQFSHSAIKMRYWNDKKWHRYSILKISYADYFKVFKKLEEENFSWKKWDDTKCSWHWFIKWNNSDWKQSPNWVCQEVESWSHFFLEHPAVKNIFMVLLYESSPPGTDYACMPVLQPCMQFLCNAVCC